MFDNFNNICYFMAVKVIAVRAGNLLALQRTESQRIMSDVQTYELAYHVNPNLEAARVTEIKNELEKMVTDNGGAISFSKEPEKTHLSYEIQHERSSYFGFIQFSLSNKDVLMGMDEQLRLHNDILRYIVLKTEPESKRPSKPRSMLGQERRARKPEEAPVTEEQKKEMEKKLEDIIEGL
ncbi:MAG: 30S ribosomal protein S6 [Candidatus Yanofskybacteria bacterium]|nr:30S ribosomal protein S6 [Candidatus Yanofskybacteria bacterium]